MIYRNLRIGLSLAVIVSGLAVPGFAQQASTNSAIPQLVNYSGVLTGINGKPLSGVAGVTFSLYAEESGGVPLWSEIQNVQMGKSGYFAAMLGSTSSTFVPGALDPSDIDAIGLVTWGGGTNSYGITSFEVVP